MAATPNTKDLRSQLDQAYEAARTTYTLIFQIVTIAVAAVGILITAAFQLKNAVAVSVAGLVLVLLVVELRQAGRVLAAVLATARRLEMLLQLPPGTSLADSVYGTIAKRAHLGQLEELAAPPKGKAQDLIDTASSEIALFRISGMTAVALGAGVALLVAGLLFLRIGWPFP